MVIFVDIDNTVFQTNGTDYKNSKPIYKNIAKINKLHNEGHTIIYWTARGSKTGKNHFQLTLNQLKKYKCKFSELRMGKPFFDLFVDDKSCKIEECDKALNYIRNSK